MMTHSVVGEDNKDGTSARKYLVGEILNQDEPWQIELAKNMIARGAAIETQEYMPKIETKSMPPNKSKKSKKKVT